MLSTTATVIAQTCALIVATLSARYYVREALRRHRRELGHWHIFTRDYGSSDVHYEATVYCDLGAAEQMVDRLVETGQYDEVWIER